jgi:hypothetical protein
MDDPINKGVKGEISPHPYILPGMDLRTHLADENIPRTNEGSCIAFDPPVFGV